ncbi:TPA: hypothetical protein ACF2DS_000770 [Clostridium perfringens]
MNLILNFKTGKTTTLNNAEYIKFRDNVEKVLEESDLLNCINEPSIIKYAKGYKTILIFENSLESIEIQK